MAKVPEEDEETIMTKYEDITPKTREEAKIIGEALGVAEPVSDELVAALEIGSVIYPERYAKEVLILCADWKRLREELSSAYARMLELETEKSRG